jgi:AraC family transcriptional regulator
MRKGIGGIDGCADRLFSQASGETLAAVYRRERIGRARDLLADPRLLVKEVAYLCGFETSAAFCKSFRASVGMSPQAFRSTRAGQHSGIV